MADLQTALRNADEAGDADAANRIAAMIREQQTTPDNIRNDGTIKGSGFFGPLSMTDGSGRTMTEFSVGVDFGGVETEIPTLVPTLTKQELDFLRSGNDPSRAIIDKAIAHAKQRASKGLSPFISEGESIQQSEQPQLEPSGEFGLSESFSKGFEGESALYNPQPLMDYLSNIPGIGTKIASQEAINQFASSIAAEPTAGIVGLLQSINPFSDTSAGDVVESVRGGLTVDPISQKGQELSSTIGGVLAPVGEALQTAEQFTGDIGFDVFGPAGGAIASAIPAAILEALGLKGASKIRGSRKLTGLTDDVVKKFEDSGIDVNDLSDANINKIKEKSNQEFQSKIERAKAFEEEGVIATKGDIGQDFSQQKSEAQLFEAADPSGEQMRGARLEQSRELRINIESMVDDLGVSVEIGDSVKDALTGRKKILRQERKELYSKLAEEADSLDIPVINDDIVSSLPDARTKRRFESLSPGASKALDDTLKDFGIIEGGTDVTPLSMSNFEDFRSIINQIEKSDPNIRVISGPIKSALDDTIGEISDNLAKSGNENIAGLAKEARKSHIALMTEFDVKSMTDKLISSKKGSRIPQVEGSQVYQKLSSKSTPIEEFKRVTDSLKKSGDQGIKAIADLKNRMLLDIIDSAFGAGSRKINSERTFGSAAFQKSIDNLRPKLEQVFSKAEMKKIDNMHKIAESIRPPSGAVPKGSAGFLIDVMNKMGAAAVMSKIPGGAILLDQFAEMSKKSKNKKAFENAMKKPEMQSAMKLIENDYPALYAMLAVGAAHKDDRP